MENCEHQLQIGIFPEHAKPAQRQFWVAKCLKCHHIFSVIPADDLDNALRPLMSDLRSIATNLAKIEMRLEMIAKKP